MLITVRGRVESDPMRVPVAASMAAGRDDSFEQVLQETVAADDPPRIDERNPADDRVDDVADTDSEDAAPEAAQPGPEPDAALPDAAGYPTDPEPASTGDPTAQAAEATEAIRRGEPVRQETAGKGADSPRTSSRQAEPLLAAVVQHTAGTAAPFVVAGAGPKVDAIAPARAVDAPARAGATAPTTTSAPLRAPAVAAPYRTGGAASVQLLEQARDSVFKQILMKLDGDGGEMRMRLEPPELGELDLRLVVEGGNRLNLTIAAERQDIAQLLQRHLDELKQTLQQAGLEVTGASVQTRSEFAREQGRRDLARDDAGLPGDDHEPAPIGGPQRGGYVSATGLDFWA